VNHADPYLVAKDALLNVRVGISVSDSADLGKLGLNQRHLDLAVGEIARAVLIAGGTIIYGGRLKPTGFTQVLIDEVSRYASPRHSLTLCVALPEHIDMSNAELDAFDTALGIKGELQTLDGAGNPIRWKDREPSDKTLTDDARVAAHSGLRRYLASQTQARIIVGGQLQKFKGAMPGVIEEVLYSVQDGQPVYLAGGLGGAAAAVAQKLEPGSFDWLPHGLPAGATDDRVLDALEQLTSVIDQRPWSLSDDGLSDEARQLLFCSHRPGDIASLAVFGLAEKRLSADA
jgi:hypothetical protein